MWSWVLYHNYKINPDPVKQIPWMVNRSSQYSEKNENKFYSSTLNKARACRISVQQSKFKKPS